MTELSGRSTLALLEMSQEVSNGSYVSKVEKFAVELSNKIA
jgi:hypothetical protein